MLIVFELIETGACRRQQNDVSGLGTLGSELYRPLKRFGVNVRHNISQIRRDFFRGGADEQRRFCACAQRLAQRRVWAAFVLASKDYEQRARKRFDGFESRIDVGAFESL